MLKQFFICFFSCFLCLSCFSQNFGKFTLDMDAKTKILFERYLAENEKNKTIDGYRIQVHFGNDREKAKEVKTKFLKQFPNVEAYESYQQPNFRIRVGDFRTRYEAIKFQKQISLQFPSSFVVNDNIKLPNLFSENETEK